MSGERGRKGVGEQRTEDCYPCHLTPRAQRWRSQRPRPSSPTAPCATRANEFRRRTSSLLAIWISRWDYEVIVISGRKAPYGVPKHCKGFPIKIPYHAFFVMNFFTFVKSTTAKFNQKNQERKKFCLQLLFFIFHTNVFVYERRCTLSLWKMELRWT